MLKIIVLMLCIGSSIASRACPMNYYCCKKNPVKGHCTLGGYVPGGNKIFLKPIQAPEATLQTSAIAEYGEHLGYAIEGAQAVADVLALTKKFAKFAAPLAAGLGIFGSVVGSVAGMSEPGPDEIIEACNKAIKKLTDEVNDQFKDMEAYVDMAIIKKDSELMNLDYKQYFHYFSGCIDETHERELFDCVQESNRLSESDQSKFLRYKGRMNDKNWKPSPNEVRHMELLFIPFRDYAELRVLILMTLGNMYENDKSQNGVLAAKRYLQDLKTETELFIRYTNFVYKKIYDMHNTKDSFFYQHKSCRGFWEQKEGWGVHTWDHMTCYYRFSEMLTDTAKNLCRHYGTVRYKSDCPCPRNGIKDNRYLCKAKYIPERKSTSWKVISTINDDVVKPYFDKYRRDMVESVKNFWTANVLINLKSWQEISDGAAKKLQSSTYSDFPLLERDAFLSEESMLRVRNAKARRTMRSEYADDFRDSWVW